MQKNNEENIEITLLFWGISVFLITTLFTFIYPYPEKQYIYNDKTIDTNDTTIYTISGFDIVIPFVLEHEGDRFVRDTSINEVSRRGITLTTYKQYFGRGNIQSIRNITIDEASEIYKNLFWDANNLDSIVDIGYLRTAIVLMDSEINLGSHRANKFLQSLIGADITGVIDEQTLSHLNSSELTDSELYIKLIYKRRQYYSQLIARREVFRKYRNGWNNRLDDICVFSKEIMNES